MTPGEPSAWVEYGAAGAFLAWMYAVPRLIKPRLLAFMRRHQPPAYAERLAMRTAAAVVGGTIGILGFFVVLIVFYVLASLF